PTVPCIKLRCAPPALPRTCVGHHSGSSSQSTRAACPRNHLLPRLHLSALIAVLKPDSELRAFLRTTSAKRDIAGALSLAHRTAVLGPSDDRMTTNPAHSGLPRSRATTQHRGANLAARLSRTPCYWYIICNGTGHHTRKSLLPRSRSARVFGWNRET